jgi:hypothetical protein
MQSLLDEVFEEHHPILGAGAVLMPENLEKGNVSLKVLAYNGGRIASMIHKPSGYEWMEEGFKNGGYEVQWHRVPVFWLERNLHCCEVCIIKHLSYELFYMASSCSISCLQLES